MTPGPDLHEIRARLGGVVYGGGRRWIGPGPGHSPRDQSLSLVVNDEGRLVWHSFAGDAPEMVYRHLGLEGLRQADAGTRKQIDRERDRLKRERQKAAAIDARRKTAWCADLWNETRDPEGSAVERYLHHRGISGSIPSALRFHPAAPLDYQAATVAPAMVALVQDYAGRTTGLHVTAIKPDGSGKAFGDKSRRMFGDIAGGAVRLAKPGPALAVAEGIETALSFEALTGTPTWAALSAAGLSRWRPPPGVETLTIAADGDAPGLRAAAELIDQARRHCAVNLAPAPDGRDWNDELKGVAR